MTLIWFIMGIYILTARRLPPAFIGGSIKYQVDRDTEKAIGRTLIVPFIMDVFRLMGLNLILPFPVLLLYILLTYFIPLFAVAHYIYNRYPRHTDQDGFLADTDIPASQIDLGHQIARQAYRSMFFIGLSLFTPLALIFGPMAVVQTTRAIRASKTHQIATRQRRLAVVTRFLSIIITLLPIAIILIITLLGPAIGLAGEGDLSPDLVGELSPTPLFTPHLPISTPTRTPGPTETPTLTTTPIPTRTPRPTRTPTLTRTPGPTETPRPTITPRSTRTPTIDYAFIQSVEPVMNNDAWIPVIQTFNDVEMALVPAGCFMMGSVDGNDDEAPVHEVCFTGRFWIDVYEVTNAQLGDAPVAALLSDDNQPRVNVSWEDAAMHCWTRGARLLTEAEWEYAARGPDSLVYPWGDYFVADNVVNYRGISRAVGSQPGDVSWVGAFDLSGNVGELVADWYDSRYYDNSPTYNPQGPTSGIERVFRGGSYSDESSSEFRAAFRGNVPPERGYVNVGFRCVRSY